MYLRAQSAKRHKSARRSEHAPIDQFVSPVSDSVMSVSMMYGIVMHPISMVRQLVPILGRRASQAILERFSLHVAWSGEASDV